MTNLTDDYAIYEACRLRPGEAAPTQEAIAALVRVIQHEQQTRRTLTDLDLAPAARTSGNHWQARYFESCVELTKANKGLRRLRAKLDRLKPQPAPKVGTGIERSPEPTQEEKDAAKCLLAIWRLRDENGHSFFPQKMILEKAGLPADTVLYNRNEENGLLWKYGPFGECLFSVLSPDYSMAFSDWAKGRLESLVRHVLGESLE